MSTQNVCFQEIRKLKYFWVDKATLSGTMKLSLQLWQKFVSNLVFGDNSEIFFSFF